MISEGVAVTRYLSKDGHELHNYPRSGPKVVYRKRVAKKREAQRSWLNKIKGEKCQRFNFQSDYSEPLHYSATSVERTALKARLADLAHLYCDSTIDSSLH